MANIDKLINQAQEQIGNENIHAVIKGVYEAEFLVLALPERGYL